MSMAERAIVVECVVSSVSSASWNLKFFPLPVITFLFPVPFPVMNKGLTIATAWTCDVQIKNQ